MSWEEIVLPVEMRRVLGIAEKDSVEIYSDGEAIILKKISAGLRFLRQPEGYCCIQRQKRLQKLY